MYFIEDNGQKHIEQIGGSQLEYIRSVEFTNLAASFQSIHCSELRMDKMLHISGIHVAVGSHSIVRNKIIVIV